MTATSVKLTLQQKLDFLPALASISIAAFYGIITGLWRTERQAKTLFLHIGYAIMRKVTARLTPSQMQYATPTSNKVYELYARKARIEAQTIQLEHGGLGHWIGDRDATNVMIWYHGGGFGLPANMGYFKFYEQLIRTLKTSNKSLAVFCLTYSLAPTETYPTQLKQAVAATRYILSTGRSPDTIFLGGDSAGGNLVSGVLSHLAHPHPQIEPLSLPKDTKLGGAAMIAPWTLLDTEFPDQDIYHGGDIITTAVAQPWATAYIGKAPRDNYTDLSNAPTEWFKDFPVNRVLITAGGNEILLPIIQDFAAKFKEGFERVELFIGQRECHVAPIYNLYLGDATETAQGKKIKSWLVELAE